jgi:hypothetical protein
MDHFAGELETPGTAHLGSQAPSASLALRRLAAPHMSVTACALCSGRGTVGAARCPACPGTGLRVHRAASPHVGR